MMLATIGPGGGGTAAGAIGPQVSIIWAGKASASAEMVTASLAHRSCTGRPAATVTVDGLAEYGGCPAGCDAGGDAAGLGRAAPGESGVAAGWAAAGGAGAGVFAAAGGAGAT